MTVLVGGVAELYQGDLDLGRIAVERLLARPEDLERPGLQVLVEDLHYGAVAVAQRLEEVAPDAVVLLGALARGRPAGTVHRRRVGPPWPSAEALQEAVGGAVTGYVDLDLVVQVTGGLGVLPARTVAFEVEPECVAPGEGLSKTAAAALEVVLGLVRAEVSRIPLLQLADQLRDRRTRQDGHRSCGRALDHLLGAVDQLDRQGRWGSVFRERDAVRLAVAGGHLSAGMTDEDWALWWTLLEELDRLQALDAGRD